MNGVSWAIGLEINGRNWSVEIRVKRPILTIFRYCNIDFNSATTMLLYEFHRLASPAIASNCSVVKSAALVL
jgi:hypothetical protein